MSSAAGCLRDGGAAVAHGAAGGRTRAGGERGGAVTEEVRFYEDVAGLTGLGGGTLAALRAAGLDPEDVARPVRAALDEDFAYGPAVTSAATVAGLTVTADVVAREAGVLAGGPVALAVLDLIGGYVAGPGGGPGAPGRGGGGRGGGGGGRGRGA